MKKVVEKYFDSDGLDVGFSTDSITFNAASKTQSVPSKDRLIECRNR